MSAVRRASCDDMWGVSAMLRGKLSAGSLMRRCRATSDPREWLCVARRGCIAHAKMRRILASPPSSPMKSRLSVALLAVLPAVTTNAPAADVAADALPLQLRIARDLTPPVRDRRPRTGVTTMPAESTASPRPSGALFLRADSIEGTADEHLD